MLLAGIQAKLGLDARLKYSGVTAMERILIAILRCPVQVSSLAQRGTLSGVAPSGIQEFTNLDAGFRRHDDEEGIWALC
jgi:hypothetical protein